MKVKKGGDEGTIAMFELITKQLDSQNKINKNIKTIVDSNTQGIKEIRTMIQSSKSSKDELKKGGKGPKKMRMTRNLKKMKLKKPKKNKTKKMRVKKMKGGNFLMDSNVRLPTHFATTGGTTMTYNLLHNQPMTDNKVYNHNIQSDVMKI